jgi:hypothetical protein
MSKLISEQALQHEIAKLPEEMTPERDLWSGIERAIQNKPQQTTPHNESENEKKVFVPTAWAASLVAAVLITWLSFSPEQTGQGAQIDLVAAMQQNFQQEKQTMLVSFGQPKIKELPAAMQDELTKLTSAQVTIEKALADDPNNGDLLNLLRWTQQQELDLLKQLYSPQWQTI